MGVFNRTAYLATLLKDRVTGGSTPLTVVLNTTSRCNLKCGYCYGQYFQSKTRDFTTKELLALIGDLGKMGTRSITLGGGEPLLRPDIGKIIKRVKDNGIECGMNTNGILIPKKINQLKKIDLVCVSLDGSKKANDANRGKGSFEKITAGIKAALAAGIKTHISAVITRYNCQAEVIDWIVDFARKKGIQAEFNFLFHQAKGKKNSGCFMVENKALRKAAQTILEHKRQGAPILFSEKVYQLVADWPDYKKRLFLNKEPKFNYIPCYAGRFMMFIDADGKVYPCVQLIDVFKALDFRQAGIKKAWKNCAKHPCKACYFPCFNELNQIMALNPKVVVGQMISSLKEMKVL